jgi:hypothetical protein
MDMQQVEKIFRITALKDDSSPLDFPSEYVLVEVETMKRTYSRLA